MRYLLGFFAVIGLVILVFVLIMRGLSGDDTAKDLKPLTDYTHSDVIMQYTATGPLVSDQQRVALRISVGRSENKIEALIGYNQRVYASQTYPSNSTAYGNFLRALDLLAYNQGSDDPSLKDERGFCPDGNLYTYEIQSESNKNQRYWQTSCGEGNFRGEAASINDLFIMQIPDYGNFVLVNKAAL